MWLEFFLRSVKIDSLIMIEKRFVGFLGIRKNSNEKIVYMKVVFG